MKTLLSLIFVFIVGCIPSSDITSDAAMALYANNPKITINFAWTAVGDNGNVGQAYKYDMRYAYDSLTLIIWERATKLSGLPTPHVAGTAEQYSTKLYSGVSYYFALKVSDKAGNWSPISNIKSFNSLTATSNLINFNQ